jgi:hypothetical protein
MRDCPVFYVIVARGQAPGPQCLAPVGIYLAPVATLRICQFIESGLQHLSHKHAVGSTQGFSSAEEFQYEV